MIGLVNRMGSRMGLTQEVRHEISNPIQKKATVVSVDDTILRLRVENKDLSFFLNNQDLPSLSEGEEVDIEYRKRGFRTYDFSAPDFKRKSVIAEEIVYILQMIKDRGIYAINQAVPKQD